MPQPRPPSGPGAAILAFMLGGAVATVAEFLLSVFVNLVVPTSIGSGGFRAVAALQAVIVGGLVGGTFLLLRAKGPIAPVLGAVAVAIAVEVGDVLFTTGYLPLKYSFLTVSSGFDVYVRNWTHLTLASLLILLLAPAVAAGVTLTRAMKPAGTPQPQQFGGWPPAQPPNPYGGPPAMPGQPYQPPPPSGQPLQAPPPPGQSYPPPSGRPSDGPPSSDQPGGQ